MDPAKKIAVKLEPKKAKHWRFYILGHLCVALPFVVVLGHLH